MFNFIHPPIFQAHFPVPAIEKHPHIMMLLYPHYIIVWVWVVTVIFSVSFVAFCM